MQRKYLPGYWWRLFWERAPRQLQFTTEGKVMFGLALAVGFAAINTGSNLLFLCWGVVLGGIIISGLLSEAALRDLEIRLHPAPEARARTPSLVSATLRNRSRYLPSFAIENRLIVGAGQREADAEIEMPFTLRLNARGGETEHGWWTPARRGRHHFTRVVFSTAYPCGFFKKSRRQDFAEHHGVWVYPAHVDVDDLAVTLRSHLGEASTARPGRGEDFYSLRPYHDGDDIKRVHWRRSARTGRWVVIDPEALTGRDVTLELNLKPPPASVLTPRADQLIEHAISTLASLAERLLAADVRVGIRTAGISISPAAGPRQRQLVMVALAQMEPFDEMPAVRLSHGVRVCLVSEVSLPVDGVDLSLPVRPLEAADPQGQTAP
jgi:uncharacterized protein (DUF58 family)